MAFQVYDHFRAQEIPTTSDYYFPGVTHRTLKPKLRDYIDCSRFFNNGDPRIPKLTRFPNIDSVWSNANKLKQPIAKIATPSREQIRAAIELKRPKTQIKLRTTCVHVPRKYLYRQYRPNGFLRRDVRTSNILKVIYKKILLKSPALFEAFQNRDKIGRIQSVDEEIYQTAKKIEDLTFQAIFLIGTRYEEKGKATLYHAIAKVLDLCLIIIRLPDGYENEDFWDDNDIAIREPSAKPLSELYKRVFNTLTKISMKKEKSHKYKENLNAIHATKIERVMLERIETMRKSRLDRDMPEFLFLFVEAPGKNAKAAFYKTAGRDIRSILLFNRISQNFNKNREPRGRKAVKRSCPSSPAITTESKQKKLVDAENANPSCAYKPQESITRPLASNIKYPYTDIGKLKTIVIGPYGNTIRTETYFSVHWTLWTLVNCIIANSLILSSVQFFRV